MSIILFYCDSKLNSWHLSAILNMQISNNYNGKYANYVKYGHHMFMYDHQECVDNGLHEL